MFTTLDEFKKKLDLSKVPVHLQEGLSNWIEFGTPTGSYLRAVLNNDLIGAVSRGDSISRSRLIETVEFIWANCPEGSYSSRDAVHTWKGLTNDVRV